jgi:gamma-glutamyltranspeptidase / glutathione hydrolase
MIATAFADLARDAASAERFLRGGAPPVVPAANTGAQLRLPMKALAKTLSVLAEEGAPALYRGKLAKGIADDVRAMGGYLSEEDLAAYRVQTVEPLAITYGRNTVHVLPELNGGPTLSVAFDALSGMKRKPGKKPAGADYVAYASALQTAWKDRFQRLGDAGERSAPTCTTHLTVIDRDGNMVTLTQTLLSLFGSRVTLPSSGILMNNGINWFDPRPGGPNSIAPDRRVLANYVPSVMTGPGGAMAVGGCGGRKIIPAVFQLLAMRADFGLTLDQLFHTPRVDVSGGPEVVIDRHMPKATVAALDKAFDTILAEPVVYTNPYTMANAVLRVKGENEAACEPLQPWCEAVSEDEV